MIRNKLGGKMKAILKFDLTDQDDMNDYLIYSQAKKQYFFINEFSDYLRSLCKYGQLPEKRLELVEEIRKHFHEIMESNDVDINLG